MRVILFFVLFFVLYYVLKMFLVNFRLGAKNKRDNQRTERPESKYDNVEEADFTEIKKKDDKDNN